MKTRRQMSEEDRLPISRRSKRTKTSTKESEDSSPIPIDLIIEILSRLPAKSIAICRCVSKSWASLLRRPDFTEFFLTRSCARPQLLFTILNLFENVLFYSTPQVQNPDTYSLPATPKFSFHGAAIFDWCGHVHGLTCLTISTVGEASVDIEPVMCNPSTRQILTLPKMKTKKMVARTDLVYDPIQKQFKILSNTIDHSYSRVHQILTLGTRSWRMIECSVTSRSSLNQVCINGSLYYQGMSMTSLEDFLIVCFDVRHEKLRLVTKAEGMVPRKLTLVNYMGKLGAFGTDEYRVHGQTRYLELWVLVDPEKNEWSEHVYELPPLWENLVGEASLDFFAVTGTGEIMLCSHYITLPFYVFYYNIESKTVRRVEVQGMDRYERCILQPCLDHVEDVRLYANTKDLIT